MIGALGHPRVHHGLTDSTNARARELAGRGAPHGTIVTAGAQSAGRGRQGRTWTAPAGRALLLSVLVRGLGRDDYLLPLAVPVAVAEAAEQVAGVECAIKWPNDVWVGGRKLAGILLEGRPQERWAVIGIGLNVGTRAEEFPEELRATSLLVESGRDVGVEAVLTAVLERLEARLADAPHEILAAWRSRDALAGNEIAWEGGEGGTAVGIDDAGALVVETASGARVALDAGEVHLIGIE